MNFYPYLQNNSGGSFDHDASKGIGFTVWIEAPSAAEANLRAERVGIYFDGCDAGVDCSCCGDRWHSASKSDARSKDDMLAEIAEDERWRSTWGIPGYIHYADGSVEEFA